MMSLPPLARITSGPLVPIIKSEPSVPTMVGTRPLQSSTTGTRVGVDVFVTVGDGVFVAVRDGVLVEVGDGVLVAVGDGVLVTVA